MDKTEYMKQLEKELEALTAEERKDALQYYEEYFDDAGVENEQAVIQELGCPQSLGAYLRSTSSCVPSAGKTTANDLPPIRGISIQGRNADVLISSGDKFGVDINGSGADFYRYGIDKSGILRIQGDVRSDNGFSHRSGASFFGIPFVDFFINTAFGQYAGVKIAITVPGTLDLEVFDANLGNGDLSIEKVPLLAKKTSINLGNGDCSLYNLDIGNCTVKTGRGDVNLNGTLNGDCYLESGMGDISFSGTTKGTQRINTGMGDIAISGSVSGRLNANSGKGDIELQLDGPASRYDIQAHSGLGDVRIGTDRGRSVVQTHGAQNVIILNTGLGDISVDTQE